jgi:hypothetical protein
MTSVEAKAKAAIKSDYEFLMGQDKDPRLIALNVPEVKQYLPDTDRSYRLPSGDRVVHWNF